MTERDQYHHGDLRNALLAAAGDMLAEEGIQGLSLRKLARQLGVSHNAPYQHFADKEALLAAIAAEGFRQLGEALDTAVSPIPPADPLQRLTAAGRSYVQFMAQYPFYLEVMFGPLPHASHPELSAAAAATLDQLIQIIVSGQEIGVFRRENPRAMAGVVWTAVHGLSAIVLAGKLPARIIGEQEPAELAASFVQTICYGLVERVVAG